VRRVLDPLAAPRVALAAPVALAALALAVGASGCGGSASSEVVAPLTGFTVRAESVTTGKGCGRGGSQVFKYVVLAFPEGLSDGALAANTYDCFADGTFVSLESNAERRYSLQVYAYNEAAFRAAETAGALQSVGETPVPASVLPSIRGSQPSWSTTCEAIQILDVQAVAACRPLLDGAAGAAPERPAP